MHLASETTDLLLDPAGCIQAAYDATVAPMPDLRPEKLVVWQRDLRQTVADLLGGFPWKTCDLNIREGPQEDMGWYRRTRVVFRSRDGIDVPAYFLTPAGGSGARATILCIHGHGPGVSSVIGLNPDGTHREEFAGIHRDYALLSVKHGYNAFAVEQMCFGERREVGARSAGPEHNSCNPIAGAALLLGQTMVGWRVYDAMRAIEYLCGRSDVDPSRIGCVGLSGGGTTTLFAAALDQRIKAAVVSGYFNSFRDSIMAVSHCICNCVPGILRHAEMYHLAGLVAPRALFIESGTRDPIFPSQATERAYAQARQIFEALGAADQIGLDIFDAEHEFHGGPCFDFLKTRL